MANNSIKYSVGFNVDKSGLNQIKSALEEIKKVSLQDLKIINNKDLSQTLDDFRALESSIAQLEGALKKAFNADLGTINVAKFNQELKHMDLATIQKNFYNAGATGQKAFRNITSEILTTNMQLKQTHKFLDNMATTMANTVKWGVTSSIFNNISGSVQQAYGYVKSLDSSLNDIRIVTGKSAEEMDKFAVKANNAAKALGKSTTDYTKASLIYYQQGLSEQDVNARAETTLKAANVTGQSTDAVSEQLTAVWNGYKVSAEEAELYIDKLAAVAATTASDLEELSTGMSKVASAAATMGVDVDQLNAQLATIVSVTRQAPESVGTALKTIYARMSDLKLGKTDEDGLGLGDVSGQMEKMGIEVLDGSGNLRDMGEVIEDVADKWDTWTEAQKTAMAQVMAGKRQYNNLMALFENWDMYEEAMNTSQNAAGTLQEQQDIYMESAEAHIEQLHTSLEDLYDSLLDEDVIIGLSDALKTVVDGMSNFVDGIGGGGNLLLSLGSIGGRVFSTQIAQGIAISINNLRKMQTNLTETAAKMELLKTMDKDLIKEDNLQQLIDMKKEMMSYGDVMNEALDAEGNGLIKSKNELMNVQQEWEEATQKAEEYFTKYKESNAGWDNSNTLQTDEEGNQKISLSTAFGGEENNAAYQNFKEALDNIDKEIKKNIENVKEQKENFTKAALALKQYNNVQDQMDSEEFIELSSVVEETIGQMKDLAKASYVTEEAQEELNKAVAEYNLAIAEDPTKVASASQKLLNDYQRITNTIQQDAKQVRATVEGEMHGTSQGIQEELDNLNTAWEQYINGLSLTQHVKGFIDLASGIGQVASGIQSLMGIKDIFNDETLSTGEKFTQILSAIGMALPMIATGVQLTGKSIIGLIELHKAGTIAAFQETLATKGLIGALGTLLPFLGPVLAITAAIGLLAVGIYAAVKAHNADADAAKESAEQVQNLTNRYNELNEAAKAFKETVSDYSDAKDELAELEKGTDEYKAKLEEVNAKAKELIETYGLFNDYTIDSDGMINIDQDALDKAQAEKDAEARDAKDRMYGAKIYDEEAQQRNARTNSRRSIGNVVDYKYYDENGYEQTGYRQLSDDEMQSIISLVQKANEEGTNGQSLKDYVAANIDESLKDNIDAIFTDENTKAFQNLAESATNAAAAQEYYAKQIMASTIEDQYGSQIEGMATDEEGNVNEGLYNQIVAATSEKAAQADAEKEQSLAESMASVEETIKDINTTGELEKYLKDLGVSDKYKVSNDKELALTYAEMMGYGDRSTLTYKGGTGVGSITDASGKKVIDGMSDEVMRREIAKQAAFDQISAQYAEGTDGEQEAFLSAIDEMIKKAPEAGAKYGVDFSTALLSAIANGDLTDLDLTSYFGELDPSEVEGLKELDADKLLEVLGIDETTLQEMGYKDAEEFQKAFEEGLEDYDPEVFTDNKMAEGSRKAEDLGLDVEEFEAYRDLLASENEELAKNLDALNDVAIANKRMAKGTGELASNWDEFNKVMSDSEASLEDVSAVMPEINSALQDVLNLDTEEFELLPSDFAKKHWDLINDVTDGVEGAVEELRAVAGQEILLNINGYVDADGEIQNGINQLHEQINSFDTAQFTIGVAIDDTGFLEACQNMVNTAQMTKDEAQAYFGAMGYDVEFSDNPQKVTEQVVDLKYDYEYDENGNPTKRTATPEYRTVETEIDAPTIKTITPNGSYGGGVGVNTSAPKSTKSTKQNSGGGSKKSKKKDTKSNDDIDKYHEVNTQIEKYNKELSKLQKQQDKLVGPDLINNLNKQLAVLEQQKAVQQQKLQIALAEAKTLQASLAAQGVMFNSDGTIANYSAMLQAKLDYLNSLIMHYNAMAAAEQEAFEATIDQAQKEYDELKARMEQYDTLISNTIPEIEASIQDIVDQEIEIQIQKFNLRMEVVLDVAEAEREFNEFKRRIIDGIKDDDIVGVAKARLKDLSSYYKKDGTGSIQEGTKHVNEIMRELEIMNKGGTSSVYGDDRARALEDLQKYYQQLMQDLEDVQDIVEEIEESYIEMIEKADEEFQKQIELYEHITGLIEHDMNVIKLVYGDSSYDKLIEYYNKQTENNLNQLDFLKLEKQFWEEQMAAEEEGSEAWQAAKEQWLDATNSLNDAIASSIENLQAKYSNAISAIFDNLNNKITGGKGLDYINEEWTLINKNADMYLDKVNSMYEIQKLENKLQESIDNTTSLYAQEKLNELLDDELAKLREKDKLTQYEVDRANMLYEIALKEIALEEAQQNKSQMKLRRDSQGNYSYQYVADSDKVGAAEQELQDAQNSLYNLDKDAYQQNLDEMLALWTEFQEKMAEAAMINDPELRAERELLIKEQYGEMINSLAEQNEFIRLNLQDSTFTELANMYNLDVQNFQAMSDEEQAILMEQMVPGWTSAVQEMTEAFAGEEGFYGLCREAFNELDIATQEYEDDLKELQDTAGVTFDDLASGLDENIEKTQELIRSNEELINEYREELNAIRAVIAEMQSLIASYKAAEAAAKAATQAAYDLWRATQLANGGSGGGGDSGGGGGNPGGGGPGSGGGPDGVLQVGDTVTYNGGLYYEDSYGGGKTGSRGAGGKVQVTDIKTDGRPYPIHVSSSNSAFGWLKQSQLSGYDTGGYTGEWANGSTHGRIALLHQKELVLNEHDTANMLAAVNIVRDIGSLLGRITGSLTGEMFNMFASSTMGPSSGMTGSSGVEQKVQIDATFPNVTSSSEIENALRNLVNVASQYASTNKR